MTSIPRREDIQIGDYVQPDGWRGMGSLLSEGDLYVDASYRGAQYRVQSGYPGMTYPVNLTITGHTLNYRLFSKPAIRVRIEWVHDGEPNVESLGWLILHH